MTRDEIWAKVRREYLSFLSDAWAVRRASRNDIGDMMDLHLIEARKLFERTLDRAGVPKPQQPGGNA